MEGDAVDDPDQVAVEETDRECAPEEAAPEDDLW